MILHEEGGLEWTATPFAQVGRQEPGSGVSLLFFCFDPGSVGKADKLHYTYGGTDRRGLEPREPQFPAQLQGAREADSHRCTGRERDQRMSRARSYEHTPPI